MTKDFYRSIMDADFNGLRKLPRVVRFQLMSVLSFMWSTVFTIWIGTSWVFGPSMAAHIVLLIAVFFTADIFEKARQMTEADPAEDKRETDESVVWGAGQWAYDRLAAWAPVSITRRA